jgi:hypothetical protein
MSKIDAFFENSDAQYAAAKISIGERTSEDSLCGRFSTWVVNNHAESHSIFLEHNYARLASDAFGMSGLLATIHHALKDDGDICFVDVGNLGPRAVFLWKGETDFAGLIRNIMIRNGLGPVFTRITKIGEPHEDVERFMRDVEAHREAARNRIEKFQPRLSR